MRGRPTPIIRSIWTCRRSNGLWQDAMKWWTFGDMKNGLGIYECHGQLERFRNGSSRAFTPQSQPDPFRNRSTAITSRGGRLVPERPDPVEQVWTRAPGCVPEPFRSQSCGVNTALFWNRVEWSQFTKYIWNGSVEFVGSSHTRAGFDWRNSREKRSTLVEPDLCEKISSILFRHGYVIMICDFSL